MMADADQPPASGVNSFLEVLKLKKKLYGLKMAESATMNDHLLVIESFRSALVRYDATYAEEEFVLLALFSLNSKYEDFVAVLLAECHFIPKFSVLCDMLVRLEQSQNQAGEKFLENRMKILKFIKSYSNDSALIQGD